MPMHDWKRVPATIYHHFHQRWTISICDALNTGLLPSGYSALVEQYSSGLYPDVLAVQRRNSRPSNPRAEMRTLEAPRTRMTFHPREGRLHERANQVVIRHHLGDVVCAYVNVPLEAAYRAAWDVCPSDFRYLIEHGTLPDENVPLG